MQTQLGPKAVAVAVGAIDAATAAAAAAAVETV